MDKLGKLLIGEEDNSQDGFLIKLRMQDIFDQAQWQEVKMELASFLSRYSAEGSLPKPFVGLIIDTISVLWALADGSRHTEQIHRSIDELTSVIRAGIY